MSMKIGIICYPTHGGSGVVATELGSALADRGHSVHVISYAIPFRFQQFRRNLSYHKVEVTAYPLFKYPPYDLALAGTIMEVSQQHGLDIIHAHYAIPHAVSAILARDMLNGEGNRMKVITTLHGTDITVIAQQKVFAQVTKYGLARSDGVTSVSAELKSRVQKTVDCSLTDIEVIPNFVDTKQFSPNRCPEMRTQLAEGDEKIVMHVSNYREVKRPLDVIRLFAKSSASIDARLIMVGDGPELGKCKELAETLDVSSRVNFIGTYDAIWEILPQADAFILPSEYESFGLSALEALSCGVPVIASNTGGLPEVIKDGETGFLHAVGDIEAMANSLTSILTDTELHLRLSTNAAADARERFRRCKMIDVWEDYYQSILAK
ncbi:MAG: N-acetyl-alpha-D-glucosaminyl L-malate synthase BshA [Planctomycetes bacterium]|nr:N-acetyl-alpha-D-glucosaminyl L-malate synthase BshA [Planctomycetota bacterium]